MPNGKHNAQLERFDAEIKQYGGSEAVCEWNNHSGMVGFMHDGTIYRVKIKRALSTVSMEHRILHACDAALAVLQTLATGAEWTFKKES